MLIRVDKPLPIYFIFLPINKDNDLCMFTMHYEKKRRKERESDLQEERETKRIHNSTILPSFFPGSCFSRLSIKILFNLEVQMRFFSTGKKKDSCLKFTMERILTDQSEKKNLERIARYLKFLGVQTSFFFSFLKRFLSDLQDKWHVMSLCIYVLASILGSVQSRIGRIRHWTLTYIRMSER